MRGEKTDGPARIYYYYCCRGKYEDDGEGGKRRVCVGHVFTLESKISHCPVCGRQLIVLESGKELSEAATCALEKCFGCKNRERSIAVNDEHCLGGDRFKDGRMQKIAGSPLCNGCPCKACCHEIREDAGAVKKYGFDAVIKARVKLREIAREVLLAGKVSGETENMIAETRALNPILNDITGDVFDRWVMNAYRAAESGLKRGKEPGGPQPYRDNVALHPKNARTAYSVLRESQNL